MRGSSAATGVHYATQQFGSSMAVWSASSAAATAGDRFRLDGQSELQRRSLCRRVSRRFGRNEFTEGRNVSIEYRATDGYLERLPRLMVDFVRRQVAVNFVAAGDVPALVAKGDHTQDRRCNRPRIYPLRVAGADWLGSPWCCCNRSVMSNQSAFDPTKMCLSGASPGFPWSVPIIIHVSSALGSVGHAANDAPQRRQKRRSNPGEER